MASGEGSLFVLQTNPLLIDTVLHSIFTFVDYGTLKESRQVCSKWKEFSDPEFIKRSAFFVSEKTLPPSFLQSPVEIPTIFSSINQEYVKVRFFDFKFTSVRLTNPLREMYLKPNLEAMVSLEIIAESLSSCTDDDELYWNFADDVIGPNLLKLKIETTRKPSNVSLEKLASIPQLELHNCITMQNSGSKMTPEQLSLIYSDIRMFGLPEPDDIFDDFNYIRLQLSEMIDFRKLKTLKVDFSKGFVAVLNLEDCSNIKNLSVRGLVINMNGRISPEELSLADNDYEINGRAVWNVLLQDLINPTAHIRKMIFSCAKGQTRFYWANMAPIDELQITGQASTRGMNSGNTIKKLVLSIPGNGFQFNLSDLAQTIEYLELGSDKFIKSFTCSTPVTFPNLKKLVLKGLEGYFPYFQNCLSLEYIELRNCCSSTILNFDHLPPNIKGLALKNSYGIRVTGTSKGKVTKLDVFLLTDFNNYMDELTSFYQRQFGTEFKQIW